MREGPTSVCAGCGRQPASPDWHPFCSERCRLQDLARWVDGEYRIAGEPVSPEAFDPDRPIRTDS